MPGVFRSIQVALLTAALAAVACGNDPAPTTPTTTPVSTTEVFAGTLPVRGTSFFSFAVINAGTTAITLGSLVEPSSGRPIDVSMGLGLGVPRREECELSTVITATPSLTAQISTSLQPGIHCVQLGDIGNLRTATAFGVRIVHP